MFILIRKWLNNRYWKKKNRLGYFPYDGGGFIGRKYLYFINIDTNSDIWYRELDVYDTRNSIRVYSRGTRTWIDSFYLMLF